MSLINDMLKDLEQRRAALPEDVAVPHHIRVLPAERTSRVSGVLLGTAIGIIAVGLVWYGYSGALSVRFESKKIVQPSAGSAPQKPVASPDVTGAPTDVPRLNAALQPQPASAPPVVQNQRVSASEVIVAEAATGDAQPGQRSMETRSTPSANRAEADRQNLDNAGARVNDAPARDAIRMSLRVDAIAPERLTRSDVASSSAGAPQIDRKLHELTPSQLAESEYRQGANLLNQNRRGEAEERFRAALRYAPGHVGARHALFGMLLQAKNMPEAERVLQEGLQITPAQPGFAMALARLQVDRGDSTGATETLKTTLASGRENPDYLAFLAALLQRDARHQQAVEAYEAALALSPNSGVWLMGLGISLQALNRTSEAREAFRRARASEALTPELQAFVDQRLKQLR